MAPKAKEKPKSSPSTAVQPPPLIEDLFSTLNKHIQRSEFQHAVKVADQVLSVAPGDEDALRCKVVALIKVDNIDGAVATIQSSPMHKLDFDYLKAYCLYRQNKLDEALESLKSQEKTSASMLLESQILYRLGMMDACVDVYQKLQKSKIDSLEINLVAGLILAGRASEVQETMDALRTTPSSSFELAYNTACSLIERKKYAEAEHLLLTARRIGRETLMDDSLADDDIEIELAPVAVQLAYVEQLLGRTQEAMKAYANVISRNLADESSLAVAANNLVALKGSKDVSDSLRKLDLLKEKDAQNFQLSRGLDKLSSKQRETIYANRVLLLLVANKMDQARELVAALPDMFSHSVVPVLLQAAVLVKENKTGKAEELLGKFAENFPENSKPFLLAKAQIAAASGHHQIAAESLSKIPDLQHRPASVATIVSLKERAGDIDGAFTVFDSAIDWWSNAMTDENKLDIIIREAASFKVKHGREEDAASLYEELVKSQGSSMEALVGLVSSVARVDVEKAEAYEKRLKALPGLDKVNVDNLEKTSGAKHVEVSKTQEEVKNKEKTKKKRKRKPKYPKGFDPANPGPTPDPERWLPRRERSSYRPKRKDKRAAQVRGSQGSVVRERSEASSTSGANSNAAPSSKSNQATTSKAASTSQPKPSSKSSKKKSRN